jgi:hypothetical protein
MTAAEINPRAMSYGYDKLRFITERVSPTH